MKFLNEHVQEAKLLREDTIQAEQWKPTGLQGSMTCSSCVGNGEQVCIALYSADGKRDSERHISPLWILMI